MPRATTPSSRQQADANADFLPAAWTRSSSPRDSARSRSSPSIHDNWIQCPERDEQSDATATEIDVSCRRTTACRWRRRRPPGVGLAAKFRLRQERRRRPQPDRSRPPRRRRLEGRPPPRQGRRDAASPVQHAGHHEGRGCRDFQKPRRERDDRILLTAADHKDNLKVLDANG